MQFIKELFSVNEILTVSIVGWFVAQGHERAWF